MGLGSAPRVHLGLVFHHHQPVGNHPFVFEELFAKSYGPLVAALERHPGIRAGLHFSGPLLEWLADEHPGYLSRVRSLVARGQVEVLGGGYYEPVLPAISESDRIGQMRKMAGAVERIFGTVPTGMWLPERVWEPDLPQSIAAGGYRWTIVDDVHFEATGIPAAGLNGWYLTEHQGETIGVFGSSTALRYLVPWGTVDDCMGFLWRHGERFPGGLVAMGDDGEKFGGWPTTFKHCWEDGWVDAFFDRVEAADWLETVLLGEWRQSVAPESLAYLPSTSYMEMGEWSLPPDGQHALEQAKAVLEEHGAGELVRYLRGGHWRNFLVRYPEANLLHKRLLHLSRDADDAGDEAARDAIWRAQCNCPYWHGVFGGVYLEHIRHANFANTAIADRLLHPGAERADVRDWDFDGRDEVCLRSAAHLVTVDPADGGAIQQWDLRDRGWNLTHVVARRPEAYHRGLSADAGDGTRSIHDAVRLKDPEALALVFDYDRGMRLASQETLAAGSPDAAAYRALRLGSSPRCAETTIADTTVTMAFTSECGGHSKRIEVSGACLRTASDFPAGTTLFSEWNLSLPDGPGGEEPVLRHSKDAVEIETRLFRLVCHHDATETWHDRVFSASNTEDGVELAPQGWMFVFASTAGAKAGRLTLSWSVER